MNYCHTNNHDEVSRTDADLTRTNADGERTNADKNSAKSASSPRESAVYTCPMHPEIQQDRPGMCPECGMQLLAASRTNADYTRPPASEFARRRSRAGTDAENGLRGSASGQRKSAVSDKHAGHSTAMFLRKFWVGLILTIPILIYSELPKLFFNWQAPALKIGYWELGIVLPLILGSTVFFYGGWVFLAGAWRELRGRLPGMMTLIGLAITAAYLWSVYAAFAGEHTLFWELATLITIMLLGHYLEMRAVKGAMGALRELSKLLPDTAEKIISNPKSNPPAGGQNPKQITIRQLADNFQTKEVPLAELKIGDLVLVRPGARVPADGKVTEGQSEMDESIVTGESKLVDKKSGAEVIAGTTNGDGSLQVEITKIGEHTFLAGVMRLVAEAQASKSRLQILSDKAALVLTVIAVTTGAITLVAWLMSGSEVAFAMARLVAVLVVACPHALGLAVPLVASISTNMAAASGFLVKQRLTLEAARKVDVALFDKTGTLTKGEFGIAQIVADDNADWRGYIGEDQRVDRRESAILQLAASVNSHSEHPLARAMIKETLLRGIELKPISDFRRIPGKGVTGKITDNQQPTTNDKKQEIFVGNEALIKELNITVPGELQTKIEAIAKQGKTINYVVARNCLLGIIALADVIRDESREAINFLHNMGVKTAMITGDSEDVAKWVAGELGIDEYFARVLPEQKVDKVKELQKRGLRVAMVGDGVNDAPALTQADVGIAIGAGTNVAIESAGIILVKNDPRDIPKIIKLSRLTYNKMMQNLFWATGYNVVAIPLAAGALAFKGILLEPALAAALMSLSTVIVAINAVLLKRRKLT